MAKRREGRGSSGKSKGRGVGSGVLGFVLGAVAAAGAGYLYLHSAPKPGLTESDRSRAHVESQSGSQAPTEAVPQTPPPARPAVRSAPFGTSEDVFEAGAHLYAARCSGCHGTPTHDASGKPTGGQFWRKARHGVASEAPGELYNQIAAGAPAKGMPAYAHVLTDTQIWQIALLLKNADQDLPDPVVNLLNSQPASSAAHK